MALSPEEQEQLDRFRQWWKENGRAVALGALLAAAGVGGWQGWERWGGARAGAAAELYREYRAQLATDRDAARALGARLRADYGGTAYATMASLLSARRLADAGQLDAAAELLEWARAEASAEEFAALAALRLGRLRAEQGRWAEGLAVVERLEAPGWDGIRQELLGDLYAQAGRAEDARRAYAQAIEAGQNHEFLHFKLDDLGRPDEHS